MKKVLSILLTLSLLVGMVSVVASADSTGYITSAHVTGVTDAVVNATATTDGIDTDAEGVTVSASWYVYDWTSRSWNDFSGTFEVGKVYCLRLDLTAEAGYEFNTEGGVELSSDASAWEDFWYGTQTAGIDIYYPLGVENIFNLSITGLDVAVGDTPPAMTDLTVDNGDLYDVTWYDNDWQPFTGSFEDDAVYYAQLSISVPDGKWFSENPLVTIDGGIYMGAITSYGSELYISYTVSFLKEHAYWANLSGLPEDIEAGSASVPTLSVAGGDVQITATEWVNENEDAVTAFETGKGYFLKVTLEPAEGYRFQDYIDIYGSQQDAYDSVLSDDCSEAYAYFYYSLKPQIETVELTVTGAEVGKNIADVQVTVPDGAKYSCEEVYIYNCDDDWSLVEDGKFEDKTRYQMEFRLEPAEGYDFAEDMDLEVLLNGEDIYDFWSNITYIWAREPVSFKTQIDKVELTVTEPKIGGKIADAVLKAPEGANYAVDYYSWYDCTEQMTVEDGTFQDKHKYELRYELAAKEDCEFNEETVATINGNEMREFWVYEYSPEYANGYAYWSFLTPIAKVEFPAFPDAKVGDSTALNITTPDGVNYTLDGSWDCQNGDVADQLEDKHVYVLQYYAFAQEGYEFTKDTVITVGGKEYKGLTQQMDTGIMVGKAFSFGMKMIDKIELTVTEPADGEKPGKVTLANKDANYGLEYIDWYTNTSGDVKDDLDFFRKFAYGNYYFLDVALYAEEGYAFADDLKLVINGKEVEAVLAHNSGAYYSIGYSFGKLTEPVPETPAAPPAPPATNPQTNDATPIAALVVLLVLAATGMAVTIIGKKKFYN